MKKIKKSLLAAVLSAALLLGGCAGGGTASTTENAPEATTTENLPITGTVAADTSSAETTTEELTSGGLGESDTAVRLCDVCGAEIADGDGHSMPNVYICGKCYENHSYGTTVAVSTPEITEQTTNQTEATTTEELTTQQIADAPEAEKKYVALTFDDGPNTTTTMEMLDVLEKHGVVASFFLIGNNINDESAKSVKRAYDMGCEIANHSKTHSDMTTMTAEEIKAEIDYTSEKIKEITGVEPRFFRPPYIAVNDELFEAVDLTFINGYGCNDWMPEMTAEKRYKRVMRQVKDGCIILMHDAQGNSMTVEAIDMIIPDLLSQGYEFVTVTQLFELFGVPIDADDTFLYTYMGQTSMYG